MTLDFSRVTLAAPLLTTAEAKVHLHITDNLHDEDVAEKLAAAEEAVLAHLGPAADASWTPATAPRNVKSAILLLTAYKYQNRGDTLGQASTDEAAVWRAIQNDLSNYRDPALA
jgi:hypothetical protein